MDLRRSLNGALAGAVAAGIWAAQQPLDKRVGGSAHDDVELLGKLITRGPGWPAAGAVLHVLNGAAFGAGYAQLRPFLPGPPVVRGLLAAQVENFALFPLLAPLERVHPARDELPEAGRDPRALAQTTWRHAIFGIVLGLLEARLNAERHAEPPEFEASSNGHGDFEAAVGAVGAAGASSSS